MKGAWEAAANVAYRLAERDAPVIVLDGGRAPGGGTSRNQLVPEHFS